MPLAPEELGRPSRRAAEAAMEAHRAVLKGTPIRLAISRALSAKPELGGKERRFAALAARELSRHQRLLDLHARELGRPPGQADLVEDAILVRYLLWRRIFTGAGWERARGEVCLPGPIRPRTLRDDALEKIGRAALSPPKVDPESLEGAATLHSFPRWLAEQLAREVPGAELGALFAALNREPPLILRARPPGARGEVLALLAFEGVRAEALEGAPDALFAIEPGGRIFESAAYKAGRLQVQDFGSQLIAELCRPGPGASLSGAHVADVCAGAGGKAMALADLVGPQGSVLAGDASWRRLSEGRERLSRAGVRNVRFAVPAVPEGASAILVDAPCSGTGTLAREPDRKWKLSQKEVEALLRTQQEILGQVAKAARPGALVVYATCSLLSAEGEGAVARFLSAHPEFELEDARPVAGDRFCRGPFLRTFPHRHPGGGYFGARLRRRGRD